MNSVTEEIAIRNKCRRVKVKIITIVKSVCFERSKIRIEHQKKKTRSYKKSANNRYYTARLIFSPDTSKIKISNQTWSLYSSSWMFKSVALFKN